MCVVLIGKGVSGFTQALFKRGADKAFVIEHDALEPFVDELYAAVLSDLVLREKPNKLLLPASIMGRSFASSVAVRVRAGITADATSLSIDKEKGVLAAVRPTFGGTLMATILCPRGHRPEIATVRPLAYPAAARVADRTGETVKLAFEPARFPLRTRHLRFEPDSGGGPDISQAQTVVAGGAGLGGPEGFELLKKLAAALGGAVGASRRAVDAGWIPYRHQIGLTGRAVRPKLYIAVGISGQIQHLAGMNSAGTIVCIDKNPEAPLMKLATFSVEGDYRELLPAILKELERVRAPKAATAR